MFVLKSTRGDFYLTYHVNGETLSGNQTDRLEDAAKFSSSWEILDAFQDFMNDRVQGFIHLGGIANYDLEIVEIEEVPATLRVKRIL